MNIKAFPLLLVFSLFLSHCFSQINGTLTDKTSQKPIKNAIIFIDKTTIKSTTDDEGKFVLENIPTGFVKLVIYKEGYSLFYSAMRIESEKIYTLRLSLDEAFESATKRAYIKRLDAPLEQLSKVLAPNETSLAAIKISKNKKLNFFEEQNALQLEADGPLLIENSTLGYQVSLYFPTPIPVNNTLISKCFMHFDTLATDNPVRVNKQRHAAYFGSIQHLLKAIAEGTFKQEGYTITKQNNKELSPNEFITSSKISGYTNFDFSGTLNVRYQLGNEQLNTPAEFSTLRITGAIDISKYGFLFSENNLSVDGSMAPTIQSLLPINFESESTIEKEKEDWINFARLQEKTYLSTDQDYYYPGETIWYSALMNYKTPEYADTLSNVIYVELIDSKNNILADRRTRIMNRIGQGSIVLPDSLTPSIYYLRAYTNWMRNYGDSSLFIRPLPVLDYSKSLNYKENQTVLHSTDVTIKLETEKENYDPEEEINFSIDILDSNGTRLPSRFSISVIDLESTARIPTLPSIQSNLTFSTFENSFKEGFFDSIQFNLERGISFSGQISNVKGEQAQAHVEIMNQRLRYLVSMDTDENGRFTVLDLNFNDSLAFSVKPTNLKGKPINNVTLVPKTIPALYYSGPALQLDYPKEVAPRIRLLHEEHLETKVLSEVSVTAKRIDPNEKKKEAYARLLGQPDNVVDGDLLKTYAGNNFLEALQGRVPGLRVFPSANGIDIKMRGMSIEGSTTPIILVDGVEFAINSVPAIPVAVIDRIEVIRRAMPILGSRGGNGVIAIYTKTDVAWTHTIPEFTNLVVKGYDKLEMFIPQHLQENPGSNNVTRTIFWRPINYLNMNEQFTYSFFASHLPGRYGIIIKGVANNIPFEYFTTFNVN